MRIFKELLSYHSKPSHQREILVGTGLSFMFKIVSMILGYISTIIISNVFGAKVIGLFNLSATIVFLIIIFCMLGFQNSILRFTGEYQNDRVIIRILKRMIIVSLLVSFPLIMVFIFYADKISVRYFHDSDLEYFIKIMIAGVPFVIVTNLMVEFLRGLRLISLSEALRNGRVVFSLTAILVLLYFFKHNHFIPAIAFLVASISVCVVSVFLTRRILRQRNYSRESEIDFKKILKVSLPMLMTTSMFLITGSIDKLMLGYFMGPKEVGIYSVAFRVAALTSMILIAINTIVAPKMSELYWAKRIKELKSVVHFSAKLIFYSSFPLLIIFILFSRSILSLFGNEFIDGYLVLIIISAGEFVNATTGPVGYFLDMTGLQLIRRNLVFLYMSLNVFLNYLLIPAYSYNGAAIATAISSGIFNVLALIYVWNKRRIFTGYVPFLRSRQESR